ncbi:MAG: OB-fold domain-containing protein [Cycloclasticus sp.]|nr:OB-fold domain-containing protein [Cycloclasticus sp.]MBQ0790370.1 OB-fold domain-containing protein [Cycloclasticus sp.]
MSEAIKNVLTKPLPTPDGDSQALWDGLKNGKLLLQHCDDCGHVQYYQQGMCRLCQSTKLRHQAASGKGTIYSYSVVYRAPGPAFKDDVPYAVLLVQLEEGPRMISSLVGKNFDALDFDVAVRLTTAAISDEISLPYFELVD